MSVGQRNAAQLINETAKLQATDGMEQVIVQLAELRQYIDNKLGVTTHKDNTSNPHSVTKAQVGLGSVDDVQQASKANFDSHKENAGNPHSVTKAQVGLNRVMNDEGVPIGTVMFFNPDTASIDNSLASVSTYLANTYPCWKVCDGTNNTPNLLDKIIRAEETAGEERGSDSDTHTHDTYIDFSGVVVDGTAITIAQMPSHSHKIKSLSWIAYAGEGGYTAVPQLDEFDTSSSGGNEAHAHGLSNVKGTFTSGNNSNTNNMQASYSLIPIVKVA